MPLQLLYTSICAIVIITKAYTAKYTQIYTCIFSVWIGSKKNHPWSIPSCTNASKNKALFQFFRPHEH
jgi:hypothetical protein